MEAKPKKSTKGPAIVLLHGLRGAPVGLADIKSSLEKLGYTVYTPAVPPFAGADFAEKNARITGPARETNSVVNNPVLSESAPKSPAFTPKAYADYFKTWLEDHNIEHPILIGHSMGSLVVSSIANFYPDLIDERIILLSPISERANLIFRVVSPLASLLPSRLVDFVTTKFLYTGRTHDPFQAVMKTTHACGDDNRHLSVKNLRKATSFSVKYGVSDILKTPGNLKICLIAGEKDRLISQKATKKLKNTLNTELYFIPGTGHIHNYEKPQETADLIDKFIQENPKI